MITLLPDGDTGTIPLSEVAGLERLVPPGWIAEAGNDVTADFLSYVSPLAGPIEPLAYLP